MDKSQKHYIEQKKPNTRVHSVWSHLCKTLEQAKLIYAYRKPNSCPLGLGVETDFTRELCVVMEMSCLECTESYISIDIYQNSSNS